MPLLDKLREQYGVGPVCSELHIAPSTYYHCQQQRHHPDKRSARAQHDDWLKKEIQRVYDENHVSNSDIIRINAVPVRSTMTG